MLSLLGRSIYRLTTMVWLIFNVLVTSHKAFAYQILGGIDEEKQRRQDDTHTENLRHLGITLELDRRRYEDDGSVSMSGTAWPGGSVLADYITNPAIAGSFQDKTVIELGSGLGICALAASFLGTPRQVIATDAAETSLNLLDKNIKRYESQLAVPTAVTKLWWGEPFSDELIDLLNDNYPDIVLASDVVYRGSDRAGLKATILALCGPNTKVVIGHTWRMDPKEDDRFFESLNLDMSEAEPKFLPPDCRMKSLDNRLPVSILELSRPLRSEMQ